MAATSSSPIFLPDSAASAVSVDDCCDDSCSICLEPFTTQNPSTVTCCKHEYHLQCILEWSQRSKECPICWQLLALKDPACQELLAAVHTERCLRMRNTSAPAAPSFNLAYFQDDFDVEQDSYSDDSDFDEHIMQHLAAVSSRAHYIRRRERLRSSGQGPSRVLFHPSPVNSPSSQQSQQTHASDDEGQDVYNVSSAGDSATPLVPSQPLPSLNTAVNGDVSIKPRVFFRLPSADAPQSPSEGPSLSESIKSKWAAASARYKESINKGTRGIKEKLLARNNSVKELSKGVQREMNVRIAGVARMIERLDLTPKRTGASSPVSGCTAGTSDPSLKGKGVQESIIAQAPNRKTEEISNTASLDVPSHVYCKVSGQVEVHHVQRDQ